MTRIDEPVSRIPRRGFLRLGLAVAASGALLGWRWVWGRAARFWRVAGDAAPASGGSRGASGELRRVPDDFLAAGGLAGRPVRPARRLDPVDLGPSGPDLAG